MNPRIARNPHAESKKDWRARLLPRRIEAASDVAIGEALTVRLDALVAQFAPDSIGFYWPLRGEFDARPWLAAWLAADPSRRAALPAIAERHAPLAFHAWTPDAPMREGHHGIPEPASQDVIVPDLLLVPCVGFDREGYRLGYGGGYYDRTLAAWPGGALPVTVGIAYEACRIDDGVLAREAHDLPLDAVVTEAATHLCARARVR
ncbi:5-formyltetrahydrofolate cyclo-ligase [Paraburkholderia lycopersici]|uniref:5-formyltetrahydrofolate cyclo-ligase n=1 Tax=Paraburkholderia lycopersici TaxID=416944 RepID=A0A1G6SXV7_9BURK|nr:5-formyltetrahydrofolate cyclo-ligase [Paraburkholderia lycopersici]SDD21623.1 5,10-methenyltetrahydrofolate synthetase [Paraburkholderia lycopersici]